MGIPTTLVEPLPARGARVPCTRGRAQGALQCEHVRRTAPPSNASIVAFLRPAPIDRCWGRCVGGTAEGAFVKPKGVKPACRHFACARPIVTADGADGSCGCTEAHAFSALLLKRAPSGRSGTPSAVCPAQRRAGAPARAQ